MPFNINGTQLLVESNALKVKDAANNVQATFDNAGLWRRSSQQPMFYACESATAGWTSLGTSGQWNTFAGWGNIIVNNYGIAESKVRVVYNGIDEIGDAGQGADGHLEGLDGVGRLASAA